MQRSDFCYPSSDGIHKVHAVKWIPEGPVQCVVQLIHGMAETIARYDDFATYLADKGIMVVGNDHIGHGQSVNSTEEWGYFCPDHMVDTLVEDCHELMNMISDEYPDCTYVLFGHSMGSMILQNYLSVYGKDADKAIICGTASHSGIEIFGGKLLMRCIALFKGDKYRSKFADSVVCGNVNARIVNLRTPFDWLTHDEDVVDRYIAANDCGFLFTINGLYTVADAAGRLNNKRRLARIPKDLPILYVSGEEDPIGNYGKGVRRSYTNMKNAGVRDVRIKLYPGMRHEILNETERETVYDDMYAYIIGSDYSRFT